MDPSLDALEDMQKPILRVFGLGILLGDLSIHGET